MTIEGMRGGMANGSNSPRSSAVEMERMVAQINRTPLMLRRHTQLAIDSSIGRVIIKVIDTETDTVVKEVPSSTVQKVYRSIREQLENIDVQSENIDINL